MLTAGIDIGSLTAKAVILKDDAIVASSIIPTGYDSVETANHVIDIALVEASLTLKQLDYIVSTGYGRVVVPFSNGNVTEISCHARGACWLAPDVRTILDMGGQDCKAIRCDPDGRVIQFAMNDKCAAGVGRYLEVIAEFLGLPLDEIGGRSLDVVKEAAKISATCTVFARSEIIRLFRQGTHANDILAGAHDALATRVYKMLESVGIESELMISGGIGKNIGIIKRLEQKTGLEIRRVPEPQIVGALGAALFAQDALLQVKS